MADKYSTIQQHQPLRVPASFDKQGRALIVQLDEIFDDVYRRFGRLRFEDMNKDFRKRLEDDEGNFANLVEDVNEITIELGDATGVLTSLGMTQAGIEAIGNKYIRLISGNSSIELIPTKIELDSDSSNVGIEPNKISLTSGTSSVDVIPTKIELKNGASIVLIDPTQINMNTDGLVSILGKDSSIIKLVGGTGNHDQTIFQADASGGVQAKDINTESVAATDMTVTNLTVTGNLNASIPIPNVIVSSSQPSGHGIIWLEPNNSVITPFSYTQSVADASTGSWNTVTANIEWSQTCNLSSAITADGATKLKISGKLYKNGSTSAWHGSLTAVANLTGGGSIDLGEVGYFPYMQSLKWDYGFSHEITISTPVTGNIESITYRWTLSRATDGLAYLSYPHAVTLTCSGETGSGSSDECTVHYIA